MAWFWKGLATGTVSYVWGKFVLPAIVVLGAPLVTIVLGAFAEPVIPWMYIWVSAIVSLAAASGSMVWIDQTIEKRRIKNKLNFAKMRLGRNIHGPGVFLGVELSNTAMVPVEFRVERVQTRVANRVPTVTRFDRTNFEVPANGVAWFDDHVIDIGAPPRPGTLEGFAEFRLTYGRVGSPSKYDLTIRKQAVMVFNADGLLQGGSWQDAA